MSVVYEGLTRSQESSPNCFVLLAIRQEKAFTQSGILQCLHYKVARVFRQSAYDVKERVPQLRLCTLVVLGGTSVRTWLAQWRALLMETLALKKTPVTCNHNFHELPLIQFAFGHSWSSAHAYFLLSWLERFETWEMFFCRIRLTTLVIETVLFLHAVRIIFVISWWLAKMYFPIWNLWKVHGDVYSLKEGVAFKWTILVIEIGIDSASAAV